MSAAPKSISMAGNTSDPRDSGSYGTDFSEFAKRPKTDFLSALPPKATFLLNLLAGHHIPVSNQETGFGRQPDKIERLSRFHAG